MSEWEGASKGSLLGYKIFAFSIRRIGLRFSYFMLIFVASYYFLFSWKSSKSIYAYFRKRHHFSKFKAFFAIYRSYFVFGQTLIDRVMISSGNKNRFTYEFDGIENLMKVIEDGKGALLISAHIGNFEVSEYFYEDIGAEMITNIVTTDRERQSIKHYLEQLSIESQLKYILIEEDMSHIFEFNRALSNNEIICITGDRYVDGSKYMEAEFLGDIARFPAGPFQLGAKLKVPVLFVYVMKDSPSHYHLYARIAELSERPKPEEVLEKFIESITKQVKRYPYQWFNYFDFWKKEEQ